MRERVRSRRIDKRRGGAHSPRVDPFALMSEGATCYSGPPWAHMKAMESLHKSWSMVKHLSMADVIHERGPHGPILSDTPHHIHLPILN